jgi:phosphatidylglycerophosphate synthase
MHPNVVTAGGFVLTVLAFYWFLEGRFGLGLMAAWLMTFLDTVDGKLARLTLTSSKFGNAFDHGIDLLHPPFWYVAWGLGLAAAGVPPPPGGLVPALVVVVGGYIVGRLIEGFFIWRYGIEIHTWRPIDSAFRLVTARRNPNLILLTAATVLGRPDLGLAAVALWTALSIVFHLVRIGQALAAAGWHGRLTSWLAESAGTASP